MTKYSLNIKIFILLTASFPVIDFFNGMFLTMGADIRLGMIYRCIFLIFLLFSILMKPIEFSWFGLSLVIFIFGNIILYLLQIIIFQNSFSSMMSDLTDYMKYFLWILIPYFIYQRKDKFQTYNYENIFIIVSLLFTLGLLIPYVLGLGYQTYIHSDAGYKGFFFANNDTSFAFIISITFTGKKLINEFTKTWGRSLIPTLLLYIGNLLSLFLVGTKTGIMYGMLITVWVIYQLFINQNVQKLSILQQLFSIILILSSVFWFVMTGWNVFIQLISGTLNRMTYFYNLYSEDFFRFLSSSRSYFLENSWVQLLTSDTLIFDLFIGKGFQNRLDTFGRLGLVEMDVFDTFFSLGIFGLFFLMIGISYFFKKLVLNETKKIFRFMFLIAILYSFFAGHVLFSALSSTLLGLICGGMILNNKDILYG